MKDQQKLSYLKNRNKTEGKKKSLVTCGIILKYLNMCNWRRENKVDNIWRSNDQNFPNALKMLCIDKRNSVNSKKDK